MDSKLNLKSLSMNDKRGMGIGDIYPALLVVALVAILIGVVLFVLDEFSEQVADKVVVTNETGAWLNITPYTVDNAGVCQFTDFVITGMWNYTDGTVIPAANYTVTAVSGYFVNATTYALHATLPVNLSYTYTGGGTACEGVDDLMDEIVDFIPWIGIILLVIAAAIVLGLLINNLAGGERV